jgi:SAM-dependent methyltransferase
VVLECGCGAGPDTEILLKLGARVVSVDLAGVDVAQNNLGEQESLCLEQASIENLPFNTASFDIVFCHKGNHAHP